MIATTKDQAARLLRCGVSADTADMLWARLDETRDHNLYAVPWYTHRLPNRKITDTDSPAWSLSALLSDILPCDISDNEIGYSLFLQRRRNADNTPTWELSYYNLEYDATLLFVEVVDPIEAAVQMAEKLIIDGYKLNGTNENEQ